MAFDGVMDAFKMPKGTDAEKAARSQAIQRGYQEAAGPPLEIARLAAAQMELARETTEIGNANAASDGACAAQSLSAAVWSATYNVEINASALKDPAKAQALRDDVAALRAQAAGPARRHERRVRRTPGLSVRRFEPGETVVLRDVLHGAVWSARPATIVRDDRRCVDALPADREPVVRTVGEQGGSAPR